MPTIGNRIRKRRAELAMSQEELGKKLGYQSRSSINKIELDQRNLTQSKIKAIADALNTTPAYIMGWDDEPGAGDGTDSGVRSAPVSEVSEKIRTLRAEQRLTLEEIAQKVGVGKSTVRKWETGMIANMKRDKIAALAAALNTTPSYLMGWADDPEAGNGTDSGVLDALEAEYGKDIRAVTELCVRLDDTDRGKIIGRAEALLEDEKYNKAKEMQFV